MSWSVSVDAVLFMLEAGTKQSLYTSKYERLYVCYTSTSLFKMWLTGAQFFVKHVQ